MLVTSDWEVFRWFRPKSSSSSPPRPPRPWYQPRLGGVGYEPLKGCKFKIISPLIFKMIDGFRPKKKLTCSLWYFCNYVISTNWLPFVVLFKKLTCSFVIFLQWSVFYKLVAFCCFDDSSEGSRPRLGPMEWILKDEPFNFNLFCIISFYFQFALFCIFSFYFQFVLFCVVLYLYIFNLFCFVLCIFFLPRWAPAFALIAIVPFPFWLKDIFAFLPTRFRLNFVFVQKGSQWAPPSLCNLFFAVLVFFIPIFFVILFILPTRFPKQSDSFKSLLCILFPLLENKTWADH